LGLLGTLVGGLVVGAEPADLALGFLSGSLVVQVDEALERFAHATPLVKRYLLEAACHGIIADGKISSREAELIRAIADAIGCPIPPFVKTAPLY